MISRSAIVCAVLTILGAVVFDGAQNPAAAAVIEPCSGPGYGPGPSPRPVADAAAFAVRFHCLWPSHQRMEVAVSLERAGKRADVEELLHVVWGSWRRPWARRFPRSSTSAFFPRE